MGAVLALSGGVGGAKLASGLAGVLAPSELMIVANTGDDFRHLGLHVSPDLDSVMYALAGLADDVRGWGHCNESWHCMESLTRLGAEDWFNLGDHDLATHILRSAELADGGSLTAVTRRLCSALGIEHALVPMSDQPLATVIHADTGELAFQDYFVRQRCEPRVSAISFEGAEQARLNPLVETFVDSNPATVAMIMPSNPMLSIAPILAVPGMRRLLETIPVVAVSPIVGGKALKGPAAKLMAELDMPVSALGVARYYTGIVDLMIIDHADSELADAIAALGMQVLVTDTIMRGADGRRRLADTALTAAQALSVAT